ncbi:hypothetical protein CN559_22365, partial [Bacillus pseudomycoides]
FDKIIMHRNKHTFYKKETFSLKRKKPRRPPPSLRLEEGVFSVKMIKSIILPMIFLIYKIINYNIKI